MLKNLFILLFLVVACSLKGEQVLGLTHHLGSEEFERAHRALEQALESREDRVVMQIHSSSGDLEGALRLAQALLTFKERGGEIIAYIQGKAVGAAAVFPFLADRLIVTPLVAWGDLTYGQEKHSDWDVLRTTIKQLIADEDERGKTMKQLVDTMVDPRYQLFHEKSEEGGVVGYDPNRLDPLILNQEGLKALKLVLDDDVMSDEEFAHIYLANSEEEIPASVEVAKLKEEFEQYLHYDVDGENLIGYLEIGRERPIDQTTYLYVKFAVEDYKKRGVRCVILHLNTPGGEVLPSLKIVDLLQKLDVNDRIPVIAFIDDWAVSAGAMLAYSCRFIGIVRTALMGAAEPVFASGQGQMESAPEKVNSVLRTEFTNLANFYGRNPLIARAMVDKDMILVVRNDEIIELKDEGDIHKEGASPDSVITDKGKLLTLDAEQLLELGVANFIVPIKKMAAITEEEREEGRWPADKSLVFQEPYLEGIPDAVMISYRDWRLSFFSFLSHPIVASMLLLGLIIGFYVEINTPGFGVPGSIGVACLALILLSSFASEAINWIEVIILIAGVVLLLLELFVIPGFGITGILGITLTVIGLFALMLPNLDKLSLFDPDAFKLVGLEFFKRLAWLCGSLIVSIAIIVILARFFSKHFFRFSKLILIGEQEKEEGYLAGIPREKMPEIGELGETVSPLRPSGKVHIGDNLFDAITQGNYMEAYRAVEVIRIEGSKVVVREVEDKRK